NRPLSPPWEILPEMSKNGVGLTEPSGCIILIRPPCSTTKSRSSLACCKLKGEVNPPLKSSIVICWAEIDPAMDKMRSVSSARFILIDIKKEKDRPLHIPKCTPSNY